MGNDYSIAKQDGTHAAPQFRDARNLYPRSGQRTG